MQAAAIWNQLEKEKDTLAKFVMPHGCELKHSRINNDKGLLTQQLLRDDLAQGDAEFFCIGINPSEEEQSAFVEVRDVQ